LCNRFGTRKINPKNLNQWIGYDTVQGACDFFIAPINT
jgi:hypothetical protein